MQSLRQQKQLCFPLPQGYVPLGSTKNLCSSGVWSVNPGEVSCTEGVALVTGGNTKNTRAPMEVYGPGGMRIMLGLLPFYVQRQKSLYIGNNSMMMCGRFKSKRAMHAPFECFKLTFRLDGKRSGFFPQIYPA